MIYLHKILPNFLLPILFFLILILISTIRNRKKVVYILIFIFYIISTPLFTNNFFRLIEGKNQYIPINSVAKADAIVVLGGILENYEKDEIEFINWDNSADRFFAGVSFLRLQKAPKLIFTGAQMPWNIGKKTEGELLKEVAISYGFSSKDIFVSKIVENTEDEVKAVKEILRNSNKIILVTSAFHMYRAKILFEGQGFEVIPHKIDFKISEKNKINLLDFFPSARNLWLSEIGLRELYGRIYYFIKYSGSVFDEYGQSHSQKDR